MSRLYLIILIARPQDSFVKVCMITKKTNNNSFKSRMEEISYILDNALFTSDADRISLMNEWSYLFNKSQAKEVSSAIWYYLWQDEEWRAKKIAQLRKPRKK